MDRNADGGRVLTRGWVVRNHDSGDRAYLAMIKKLWGRRIRRPHFFPVVWLLMGWLAT